MLENLFGKYLCKPRGYIPAEVISIRKTMKGKIVTVRWFFTNGRFEKEKTKEFPINQIEKFYHSSTPFTRWLKKKFHRKK